MKRLILFVFLAQLNTIVFCQEYCDGSIIVGEDTIFLGWRGKEKVIGNVPSIDSSITTGWVVYLPFTDEFNTFDYSKWTKKMGHVIQCHQILIFQVVLIMFT